MKQINHTNNFFTVIIWNSIVKVSIKTSSFLFSALNLSEKSNKSTTNKIKTYYDFHKTIINTSSIAIQSTTNRGLWWRGCTPWSIYRRQFPTRCCCLCSGALQSWQAWRSTRSLTSCSLRSYLVDFSFKCKFRN